MIINEDFRFRDDIKADTVPVELLTGPYKGVILRYTKVGINEMNGVNAVLKFQYELYEMGDHTETALRKDKKFEEFAGLILNTLIIETATVDESDNAVREDNTQELASE